MRNFRIKRKNNSFVVQKRHLVLFWTDMHKHKWHGLEKVSFKSEIEAKVFISFLLRKNIGLQ